MKAFYALIVASVLCACGGPTPEAREQVVTLSNDIARLSDENQNLLRDIPIKQRASDTLLVILGGVRDEVAKSILVKEIGALQKIVEDSKARVSANASELRQKSLELRRITTGDQQIVLSDSVTKVAITQSDTMIRLVAMDSTVK